MLFYKRIDTFGLSLPNMQQANWADWPVNMSHISIQVRISCLDGSVEVVWSRWASIFVIRGSYLTTLLLFWGAGGLFSHQVVLRLSLSPTPLRTPSSVWIKLGAGLHGWLNTEELFGPPISQRERLTHNESSSIWTSSIIVPIASSSMGMLSFKLSMQHSHFSCFRSIIPTVWQFPHNHTPPWLHSIQAYSQQHRGKESAYTPSMRG